MVILIDGMNLLFRYIHNDRIEFTPEALTTGVMRSINKERRVHKATDVIFLWDMGKPAHRLNTDIEYKAGRDHDSWSQEKWDVVNAAKMLIGRNLLPNGYMSLSIPECEADDLAYYITTHSQFKRGVMISQDFDWLQSVNPNWSLYRPISNKYYDYTYMKEWLKNDINPTEQYIWYKSLVGDGSDGIPGIYGIGGAYGVKFSKFLLEDNLKGLTGAKGRAILENLDKVKRNYSLIDMSWIKDKSDEIESQLEEMLISVNSTY